MDLVAVTTRHLHRPDPTLASTKVKPGITGLSARSCDTYNVKKIKGVTYGGGKCKRGFKLS